MKIFQLIFYFLVIFLSTESKALNYWLPCHLGATQSNAKAEGRTEYIAEKMGVNTRGINVNKLEDLYCVTRPKCIALGYCTASNIQEQVEADKLKKQMVAQEAKLKREQQRLISEAEAKRKQEEARIAAEEKRRQDETQLEKQKIEKLASDESKRLNLSQADAFKLANAKYQATKVMPKSAQKCVTEYPAHKSTIQLSSYNTTMNHVNNSYSQLDRSSLCNGRGGTLGPLKCEKPLNFMGTAIVKCSAEVSCPAERVETICSRGVKQ